MDFTFGIITSGESPHIFTIIDSIRNQKIPNYEIIIVGGNPILTDDVCYIPFDESVKSGWITAKKNIICKKARYENIVLMHDYITLMSDWYEGFLKFGSDFKICVNKILNNNNTRFRDYTIFPNGIEPHFSHRSLLPYDYDAPEKLSKILYISGSYYVIKKTVALEFPLDERLAHNDAEDVELCFRLANNKIYIKCNKYSSVKFLKYKYPRKWENELTKEEINYIESQPMEFFDDLSKKQIVTMMNYICNERNIDMK
jgi:hypothetical protein